MEKFMKKIADKLNATTEWHAEVKHMHKDGQDVPAIIVYGDDASVSVAVHEDMLKEMSEGKSADDTVLAVRDYAILMLADEFSDFTEDADAPRTYMLSHEDIRLLLYNTKWHPDWCEKYCTRYIEGTDLGICMFFNIAENEILMVPKDMPRNICVPENVMFDTAMLNSAKTAVLKNVEDVMQVKTGLPRQKLYVLSNEKRVLGSGAIVNFRLLNELMDRLHAEKLIVIPKSVHELIITTDDNRTQIPAVMKLISIYSDNILEDTERLSDHAYWFDGKSLTEFKEETS